MKTFAEYLTAMTTRDREIVEAYKRGQEEWHRMGCDGESPYDQMLSTQPAKEPVSVELLVSFYEGGSNYRDIPHVCLDGEIEFQPGDRVRVVKIEEVQP